MLGRELGQGSFGRVMLAEDRKLADARTNAHDQQVIDHKNAVYAEHQLLRQRQSAIADETTQLALRQATVVQQCQSLQVREDELNQKERTMERAAATRDRRVSQREAAIAVHDQNMSEREDQLQLQVVQRGRAGVKSRAARSSPRLGTAVGGHATAAVLPQGK